VGGWVGVVPCSGAAAAAALGVSTCVKSKVELRKTVKLS
jgi:hypothetical protein